MRQRWQMERAQTSASSVFQKRLDALWQSSLCLRRRLSSTVFASLHHVSDPIPRQRMRAACKMVGEQELIQCYD